VTKPADAGELAARIRALLRRTRTTDPDDAIELGAVSARRGRGSRAARRHGGSLTKTEFRLLCTLATAKGAVVTREQLLERVWDYDYFGDTRLLDVHIRRLRRKIEPDPAQPTVIVIVRGLGSRTGGTT
jgi:two-component system response regulator MtrA